MENEKKRGLTDDSSFSPLLLLFSALRVSALSRFVVLETKGGREE